ncbi:MAG TPA: response regulator [Geobacteraceae bacterium]|nr:response regulator [Geobacteraceae bacterium]
MEKGNILIVEDDRTTAKLINLILTNAGYTVMGMVSSGEKAVDIAIKTKPDLVLMDIKLKGKIDGISAFNEIRKVAKIPMVFISAYTEKEMVGRARQCDPDGYIVKPFKMETLLGTVASVLDWQRIVSED